MAINFPNAPTNGQIYTENGKSWIWNSLLNAWNSYSLSLNGSTPAPLEQRQGIVTERHVYNGLAVINGESQSRDVSIYAPTTSGTLGQVLTASGPDTSPTWGEPPSSVIISTTPPLNPEDADMWWDSVNGKLKIYYVDGLDNAGQPTTVGQWVDAAGAGAKGPAGPQGVPGPGITDIVDNLNGTITIAYGNGQTDNVSFNGIFASVSDLNAYAPLASPTFTGVMNIPAIIEAANILASAPTSTTNFDIDSGSVWYYTSNTTTSFTLNIRGSSSRSINERLGVGKSLTIALLIKNGGTAYLPTPANIQIDGLTSNRTIRWQGGTAPTGGNTNSVDIYTFTIVKTASTPSYDVFASQTKYA
jgi:hypothetical protein